MAQNRQSSKQTHIALWRQCVRHWYPKLHKQAYFVPPVHMNRVPYQHVPFADTSFDVPQAPMESPPPRSAQEFHLSTAREDMTLQRLLFCLHALLNQPRVSDVFTFALANMVCCLQKRSVTRVRMDIFFIVFTEKRIIKGGNKAVVYRLLLILTSFQCQERSGDTHGEPVVVLSELQFGDYLGEACYAAAASVFPRPVDLKQQKKHRGDFDLLFLHERYHIVVAEIKSIGDNFPPTMREEEQDGLVAKRIDQSIKQLNKAHDVLNHVISDLPQPVLVRKTLMLPNITRGQLRRVLGDNQQVQQDLCKCLGILDTVDPAYLCLTADEVSSKSSPFEVTDEIIRKLQDWWGRAVAGPLVSLESDVFENLVARFAGPATTVRVFSVSTPPLYFRSQGEGVAETSRRFTQDVVLNPYQVDILNGNAPLVFLAGPPGTGKTVVLVVRGRDWLCRGWPVHVLSTWPNSLAASHMIVHQLRQIDQNLQQAQQQQQGAGFIEQRVHLHTYDFRNEGQVDAAVKSLLAVATPGPLCILADEAVGAGCFTEFCDKLCKLASGFHLWAASLYHKDRPPCLTEAIMTQPLRTPPLVTREVVEAQQIKKTNDVLDYTAGPAPLPTDGPRPRILHHRGDKHDDGSPHECEQCGKDLAELFAELHIARPGNTPIPIPAPLTYRDVFLMMLSHSNNNVFEDEVLDEAGNLVKPASGLLRGLRQAGIPVTVVKPDDGDSLRDVTTMAGPNSVLAVDPRSVNGLERAVVVWVQSDAADNRTGLGGEFMHGRLWAMSRTTSQLISIVWSKKTEEERRAVRVTAVARGASESTIAGSHLMIHGRGCFPHREDILYSCGHHNAFFIVPKYDDIARL